MSDSVREAMERLRQRELEELRRRGIKRILSSDCHDSDFLSCGFNECLKRYSNCRIVDFEKRLK